MKVCKLAEGKFLEGKLVEGKWGRGIGRRRVWFGGMVLAAAVLGFCGCGSSKASGGAATTEAAAVDSAVMNGVASDGIYMQEFDVAEEPLEEDTGVEGDAGSVAANRKLIRSVDMSVETEEFDGLVAKLEQKVAALGGYVENMSVYNGSRMNGGRRRSASMTVRVPKECLDLFVGEVSEVSNVVSKSERTEDVTLSYVDLESHKRALQVEQERLMELLGQAVSMEDIIAIEERLSQVRYELESMESRLRTYDNLVDFSTVYLNIDEVERLTPVEEVSDFVRMGRGFVRSVENLFAGIKNFLIGVVICLPYLVFWAVLAVVAVLVVRVVLKRGRQKKGERFYGTYGKYGEMLPGGQMERRQESEARGLGDVGVAGRQDVGRVSGQMGVVSGMEQAGEANVVKVENAAGQQGQKEEGSSQEPGEGQ